MGLNSILIRCISRLTMKKTDEYLLIDKESNIKVWIYIDYYGKKWLAKSKWKYRLPR